MSEITIATYNFLDALDNSDLMKNLNIYKNKLLNNKEIQSKINDLKKETDNDIIISKRKEIFNDNDYKMYMHYYNELSLIILRINKQYAIYTNTTNHSCN